MRKSVYVSACVVVLALAGWASPAAAQSLGTAHSYGVMAGSGVTAAGGAGTIVSGDVGSSPTASITGFPPAVVTAGFAVHPSNDASNISAQAAVTSLYTALGTGACTTNAGAQLSGANFGPGIHCFASTADLAVNGTFTLSGAGTYIFRVGSALNANTGSSVNFAGVDPCNVFWQVTSAAALNGTSFAGNVVTQAGVHMGPSAALTGRALATAAGDVTLAGNNSVGGCSAPVVAPCPTVSLSPSTLPNGTVGVAYSQTIVGSGGTGPYVFTVTAGALPAGLTLTSAGVLAGTPTEAATSTPTIRATDANACFAERPFTITIAVAVPTLPQVFVFLLALSLLAMGSFRMWRRSPVRIVGGVCAVLAMGAVARAQNADTFDPGANQVVNTIAIQGDGKILVGGQFTGLGATNGTTTRNRIGRIHTDGSVDATFNPGTNGPVMAIALQPDGKILIGGNFTSVGGGTGLTTPRSYIARLNEDGSVDTNFNPGASLTVYAIVVQPDGKILVGGEFARMGGGGSGVTTRNRLARLNSDGSVDSFDPGASKQPAGASAIVYAMALQPDGGILVGGYFNGLGGGTGATVRNYIGRINADGTLDAGFNPGASFMVNALAVQADGKIIVGGDFTGLGGGTGVTSRLMIGRLHFDGLVDTSFNPGAEAQVLALGLQTDGKILAGGYFKWLGGQGGPDRSTRNYLGRFNADGSVDSAFNPGANNLVNSLAIQGDGAIVAAGIFGSVGGGTGLATGRNRLARFTATGEAVQTLTGSADWSAHTWMRSGGGPEVSHVTFEFSFDGSFYSVVGIGTRIAGGWQSTGGVNLPNTRKVWHRARGYYGTGYQTGSGSIVESIVTTAPSDPRMSLDGPANNATLMQPFITGGWAVDLGAPSGAGVDAIHVYAFPIVNGVVGAGIFVSEATLGGVRGDVSAAFGSQFVNAGFNFLMDGLNPGQYFVGVYVHSSLTGTFNQQQFVPVTIIPRASIPVMSLDGPANNSTIQQPFVTGGWAVDLGASSGVGIDAIHVWAFPVANGVIGSGIFVDQATLGGGRSDVAAAFGSQFANAGFNFVMTGLAAGQYYIGVYVRSTVAGTFNQQQFALVTIQ